MSQNCFISHLELHQSRHKRSSWKAEIPSDITDQGDCSWRCVRMSISISFFQRSSKREKEDRNGQAKQTKKENLWTSENGYHKVIRWPSSKLLGDLSCTHYAYQKLKLWKVTSGQLSRDLKEKPQQLKNPAKFIICFFAMLLNAISAKLFAKSYSLENYLISTENLLCAINWHYKRLRQSFSWQKGMS